MNIYIYMYTYAYIDAYMVYLAYNLVDYILYQVESDSAISCIWMYMNVYECIWMYMNVYECIWMYMNV